MINTTASSIASLLWAIFNIYVVIDMLISMWKWKKEKQILLDTIEDYQEEIDDLTAFNNNWEINYCDLMTYIEYKDNIIEELQDKIKQLEDIVKLLPQKQEEIKALKAKVTELEEITTEFAFSKDVTEESVPDSKL